MRGYTPLHAACSARGSVGAASLVLSAAQEAGWHGVPGGIDAADHAGESALHVAAREAPEAAVPALVALLVGSGASVGATGGAGETLLHLLAQRGDGALGPGAELLALLGAQPALPLDAQSRAGNAPVHLAAFGGAERLALWLAAQGAWVSLPNADGLCALDTAQRCADGAPLRLAILRAIRKPPHWVRDRLIGSCQLCKASFSFAPSADKAAGGLLLPARKHHCRHCGRCVCAPCSAGRAPIAKFGGAGAPPERVCAQCEAIVAEAPP